METLTARFHPIRDTQGATHWGWLLLDKNSNSVLAAGMRSFDTKETCWEDLKQVLNAQELEIEGYE